MTALAVGFGVGVVGFFVCRAFFRLGFDAGRRSVVFGFIFRSRVVQPAKPRAEVN